MSVVTLPTYRKVSLAEARQISLTNADAVIIWRPEEPLPEAEQYALVYNE
jgi:hypothetical protein